MGLNFLCVCRTPSTAGSYTVDETIDQHYSSSWKWSLPAGGWHLHSVAPPRQMMAWTHYDGGSLRTSRCQSGNPEVSSLESNKTSKILVRAMLKGNSCERSEQEKKAEEWGRGNYTNHSTKGKEELLANCSETWKLSEMSIHDVWSQLKRKKEPLKATALTSLLQFSLHKHTQKQQGTLSCFPTLGWNLLQH